MNTPPLNLAKLTDWSKVLAALDIVAPTALLPCTVRCPLCRGSQLVIYQNTTEDFQWHYCRDCHAAGDMLQLAARVWDMPTGPTLQRLQRHVPGLAAYQLSNENVETYLSHFPGRQQRTKIFLENAAKQLLGSTALRQLRLKLGVTSGLSMEAWQRGAGRFAGSATREQLDEFFDRNKHNPVFHHRPGRNKSLETLLIPFWDLPEHISALLCCYEQKNQAVPFYYYALNRQSGGKETAETPGIAMLEALHAPGDDDIAYVFLDPLLALRTHIRHCALHPHLLPLVALWPEISPCPYLREHAPTRELVFWDKQLTPDLFHHAAANNGLIVTHCSQEELYHHLRRMAPAAWMKQLRRDARKWDAVLEEQLAERPLVEAEALFFQLNWSVSALQEFLQGCVARVRQRLQPLLDKREFQRRIVINGRAISITEKGWASVKSGEMICNALPIIQRVIHYSDGQTFYQGEIHFQGQKWPFTAPVRELDQHFFIWLKDELVRQGAGVPDFIPSWQRIALPLALRFHPPEVIKGAEHYGWDEKHASFLLVSHAIRPGGKVEEHHLPVSKIVDIPWELPAPRLLTTEEIAALQVDSPAVRLVWAITSFVLHNVLATPLNYQPLGLMVVGNIMETVTRLARGLGCNPRLLAYSSRTVDVPAYMREEAASIWPVIFARRIINNPSVQAWLRLPQHNLITRLEWYASRVFTSENPWCLLEHAAEVEIAQEDVNLAGQLFVAYLIALMERRLQRWTLEQPGTFKNTVDNLALWFKQLDGPSATVYRGAGFIQYPYSGMQADMFLELLSCLFDDGEISQVQLGQSVKRYKKVPPMLFTPATGGGTIWLAKTAVNMILQRLDKPRLDISAVTRSLKADNKLLEESDVDGMAGWVIDYVTWQTYLKRWRSKTNDISKVI